MMPVNNPINHGWKEKDGKLFPIWTTLPLAKDVFHLALSELPAVSANA